MSQHMSQQQSTFEFMADKKIFITRDEYPRAYEPKKPFRGKPHVFVSVPRKIQHLFKSNTFKMAAPNGFIKDEIRLTNRAYDEMDRVQSEAKEVTEKALNRELLQEDLYIEGFIKTIIDMFPHLNPEQNSGTSAYQLDLSEGMELEELQRLRMSLDIQAKMVRTTVKTHSDRFTTPEKTLCFRYLQPDVTSWWEDIITESAVSQNKPIPIFPDPKPEDYWDFGKAGDGPKKWMEGNTPDKVPVEQPLERKTTTPTMSMLKEQYLKYVRSIYPDKQDTRNKVMRPFRLFIEYFDDPIPSNITLQMAKKFPFLQMEEFPNRAKRTLRDYNWGMNTFTDFCITNGLMDSKPFFGLSFPRGLGAPSKGWRPFTDKDLDKIFAYNWNPQEHLLISMALSTGMRMGEMALLTWERIKGHGNHFNFVTLLDDPELFDAATKNEGSKRIIPLNDSLELPPRREGRVFDYSIDGYGLASTSAGRAVNPILNDLLADDRKSFHSFRSTFKIKLDETGITDPLSDLIMGHGKGDNSGKSYRGMTPQKRYESIQKMDVPWLKNTPN